MRSLIVMLAACATTMPVQQVDHRVHSVTCGGKRIAVPSSLHVVHLTGSQVIVASRDVALGVFEDGPTRTGHSGRVIEQISDLDRPVYRIAFGEANRCTFRAVALLPASADGLAIMTAVAGTSEPSLFAGSPRVPSETALRVLLRQVQDHLVP